MGFLFLTMAKNPAFPFYASDFLTDVNSWEANEVGIYIKLLATQWVNGSIPNDKRRISIMAGVTLDELEKAWVIIGLKFGLCLDNVLKNPKLEETRAAKISFLEKQALNGKKGGRPPKNDNFNPKNNPDVLIGLTQTISQKNPLEEEKEVEIEKEDKKEIEDKKYRPFDENDPVPEIDQSNFFIPQMLAVWKTHSPGYAADEDKDFKPISELVKFFVKQEGLKTSPYTDPASAEIIKISWDVLAKFISKHNFFCNYSLYQVSNHIQSIIQSYNNEQSNSKTGGSSCDLLEAKRLIDQMSD